MSVDTDPEQVLLHRCTRDVIDVSGPDAETWLQGQLSQDVVGLPVGGVSWTFVLSPQGKVEGWGRIRRASETRYAIDVDPGAGQAWVQRLDRFKLRTRAEVVLREAVPTVAVRGALPQGFIDAGWPGVVGGDLLDAPDATALAETAGEDVARPLVEIDDATFEALRIRSGVPRWGSELDPDTIPATVGQWIIDASVSFTKGCYTGQELVARIDSRGGNVPRRLAVLVSDGELSTGDEVTDGDDVIGTVTSSAPSGNEWVALAYVKRGIELPTETTMGGHSIRVMVVGGAERG